jgi:hypothetical protein
MQQLSSARQCELVMSDRRTHYLIIVQGVTEAFEDLTVSARRSSPSSRADEQEQRAVEHHLAYTWRIVIFLLDTGMESLTWEGAIRHHFYRPASEPRKSLFGRRGTRRIVARAPST